LQTLRGTTLLATVLAEAS